ncbi:MAG: DoxX family membrane protein [Ferrovum sp.]|nr:DoxX family membrane protein [Ferrovum sp.]NDU88145.1 DoxX family membrane protein [Ferrovum sp.]
MNSSSSVSPPMHTPEHTWRVVGLVLLCARFVQGWIYWGGGSRRFIYAPSKIDPTAHHWMANKFQTAMPGALLGMDQVVSYMLQHFYLLYGGVIFFSAAELFVGLFLIIGFYTRLAALASIGLSFVLMLLFGWQGATCIDEWTMAAANFGMGASIFLGGGGAFSVDAWRMKHRPGLASEPRFHWIASGPISEVLLERVGKALLVVTVVFVVATYSYFRGSVVGAFHGGPVSPSRHHLTLSKGRLDAAGAVSFHVYLDGGSADVPGHIVKINLHDPQGKIIESWNGKTLAALPKSAFVNDYIYNQFEPGMVSIQAEVGAKARIDLPPAPVVQTDPVTVAVPPPLALISGGRYTLEAVTIDAKKFTTVVIYEGR